MADTQNDNQQQPPRGGLLRAIFDRGIQDGTIQSGPISPARRVQPLLTGVTSEAQPRPISLQGAGMDKPRKAKVQQKPELVGKVGKGAPVQPIAVPEVSDIQSFAPQRQLTEAEIERDRTKYVPDAIENTIITARNSASDKTYFDNFVAPNLRKTLSEDIQSGELSTKLNNERYPIITRQVDGIFENIILGVKDRYNAIKSLDEYDRLDDQGKIQFLSGKSTLRMPTLSQVGSPTRDLYSGQTTQEYQGAVPTERGTAGEIAYGVGGVLPDIATGIVTAPLNVVIPGYSLASVAAIQGRTGRINAAQQAFQVAKMNGLNDEEALQVAKNAEKPGAITGALEGAASQFFGSKILKAFAAPTASKALTGFAKQAKQFLKDSVTATGKSAAPLAIDMTVAGGMEIVRQEALADQNLENPNRNQEILDNVKMEGIVGLAFAIVGKATKVPKYLQSYATSALASLDPNDLVDYATELELTGQSPAGFAKTVRDEVKKYNDAKKAAGDSVGTEAEGTIVGLIMKKKGLQDKLKDADDTIKPQIQAQIDELNTRITTTLDTKVPQEVDDKTQSKIEQDATKENEQVSTVQEGGPTEPSGVIPGQQEVGQGEGGQRQTTEQGANIGDSNIGSQAEVAPELDVAEKARRTASRLRSGEANVLPEWLRAELPEGAEVQGLDINNIYAKALEVFAETYEKLKDFKKAADKAFKEISGWFKKNNVRINEEDVKSKFESQLNEPIMQDATSTSISESQENETLDTEDSRVPTEEEVLAHAATRKQRQQEQAKEAKTVNQTYLRKFLKAIDENQVNVIKELRKTGQFSDLLVSALEKIRQTSVESNEKINEFNKNVYNGLSDKPTIQLGNQKFSEKGLLEEVIRVKRLIEIQRMLGDKFNRFQQFDAEYNTALAEYETIDKAAAKVKKKLDSITEEINEINKKIVEANLDEKNQGEFDKLVELVRDRHQKADKIMSEIESRSEEIKAATDKVIEARNKRQKSLEYIAERGVLIRNQDGTYSLGKYKMESINGVPYTSDYAKVFLNAASKYDKFSDIDARSESAFSAFKSILDEQYEAGLVSQAVYDDLSQYKYVPIRYINETLLENNSFVATQGGNTIKSLKGGSDGAAITDYSALFNVYATTALRNIASNKALQLLDIAVRSELPQMDNTNIFNQDIAVKVAETEKNNDGTDKTDKFGDKVYVKPKDGYINMRVRYSDGDKMLTVPEWFSKEFYQSSKTDRRVNMVSMILGVKAIRFFATIANAGFGVTQLVTLDPIQAILTARGINPVLPVGYTEIAAQWVSASTSIRNKDAIYKEAVKNGVFGDIALRSGMDKFYDNKIFTGIKYIDDSISHKNIFEKVGFNPLELFGVKQVVSGINSTIDFSESIVSATEKMTRLIVYKKSKKYFMDKGFSSEEAGQLAASESRNTANFSRVGDAIKFMNNFIPYLSASYATKRAVIKAFKKSPGRASFVMSQMVAGATYATLFSIGALSDDEKEKEYWGDMYRALPDYYKKNYAIIRNPKHNIGDGVTNAFIKVPLPFLAKEMYTGFVSYGLRDYMNDPIETDSWMIPLLHSVRDAIDMVGVGQVSVPPTLSALSKGFLNIDPFTGYEIVSDESTGGFAYAEKKDGTLPMIQAIAEKSRLVSGPRTQAAIESFTGDFKRNPLTQITVNLMNSIYEKAAGKDNSLIKAIKEDPSILISSPVSSVGSRLVASPEKYYLNQVTNKMMDYALLTTEIGGNDVMQNLIKSRAEKTKALGKSIDELREFLINDMNSLLKDIEKDLGPEKSLKYKKMVVYGMNQKVIETIVRNVTKDVAVINLVKERNPSIRGRVAYDIMNSASSDQRMSEISGVLGAIEFFKDSRVLGAYTERAIEDNFGSEYLDAYKKSIIETKASVIEDLYKKSKDFSSDSKEVKQKKLDFIDYLRYMESEEYSKTTLKGDMIKEKLFQLGRRK
jgi:hypothetical protein